MKNEQKFLDFDISEAPSAGPVVPDLDVERRLSPSATHVSVSFGQSYVALPCSLCGSDAWTLWVTPADKETFSFGHLYRRHGVPRCVACVPPGLPNRFEDGEKLTLGPFVWKVTAVKGDGFIVSHLWGNAPTITEAKAKAEAKVESGFRIVESFVWPAKPEHI